MGNDITERFIINMYVRGMKISEIANTVNITQQEVTEIIKKSKREIFKKTEKIDFSPIYDCGSCLNPMIEDEELEKITETEIKNLAINSYSCIKEKGKKINYITYI